jgi:hypothetical protein
MPFAMRCIGVPTADIRSAGVVNRELHYRSEGRARAQRKSCGNAEVLVDLAEIILRVWGSTSGRDDLERGGPVYKSFLTS